MIMESNRQRYEFQEPANMKAIRSNIIKRIKKRNDITSNNDMSNLSLQPIDQKLAFLALDSGLPSPPSEPCSYEESVTSEIMLSPTSTLPESPPSPTLSKATPIQLDSADAIREKLDRLKQEKHFLFQTMKNLLSEPSSPITTGSPKLRKEDEEIIKAKPIIRSRSVSQTEFTRPPRYNYYRNPPPRFYNSGYRFQSQSRRNSSYVSSRSQLIIRPSASASASRLPSNRPRY